MIRRSMKKVLSSVVIATYLMVYTAPIGFCITTTPPKINAEVNKPALRGSAAPSSLKLEGDISISKGNPKISLSLRDSDVKQVLRMFADKAGLNIVFHDSVGGGAAASGSGSSTTGSSSGKVTLDLVNVPLNDAFKLVMQVAGLTYFMDKNTMVVTTAEAAKTLNMSKQEMVAIPVKYIDAATMADFLNKNIYGINKPGLSNANVAITNAGENEILIMGTENDVRIARKVVAQFDIKPREEIFAVNHTTPAEMANLICTTLMAKSGTTAATSSSSSSSSSSTGITLGASTIACQFDNTASNSDLSSFGGRKMLISYFTQRGTITVLGGSNQQMEMIKEFIQKNDKKQPQAYLEISIIELNEDGSREFNNTWNVWSENFAFKFDGKTATNPLFPTFFRGDNYKVWDMTDPAKPILKGDFNKFTGTPTVAYTMSYLIHNQKGRVLANPRIMVTNGQQSTLDLSSDYIKTVTSQIVTTGLTPVTQRTYNIGTDDGIKVDLTPFISPEGYVTLNIKPQYSTIKEKVYTPAADGTPSTDLAATLLQRRNLDLKNVRIKDGETLVIGGMIREDEQKTVDKFPVLGDLPGIGMFFRNSSTTKSKQELVIMLTPKIIKDSEDVVNDTGTTL